MRIFNKIKQICTNKLNVDIIKAVVAVPSYFNPVQRQAIKNAIDKSGIVFSRFINEAMAISIAYSRRNNILKNKQIMVVDFGGGKLESTIVEITDSKNFVQIIAKGDNDLGGEDVNDQITEHYIKLLKRKSVDIRNNKKAIQKLRLEIEKAKCNLSSHSEVKIEVKNLIENYNFSQVLSIENFETLNKNFFQRFSRLILNVLKEASRSEIDLSEIILTGGSTKLPQIHKIIEKLTLNTLGHKIPILEMNEYIESTYVAFGAAYLFADDIHVLNLIPFSLGFSKNNGEFEKLIEKNTYLPAKHSSFLKTNDCNSLLVYLGDSLVAKENDFLLKFSLKNVKFNTKQNGCNMLVSFDLDVNGILEISAKEKPKEKTVINESEPRKLEKQTNYEPFSSDNIVFVWTFYIISFFLIFAVLYFYCVKTLKENEARRIEELEARRREEEIRHIEEMNRIRATILEDFIRQIIASHVIKFS